MPEGREMTVPNWIKLLLRGDPRLKPRLCYAQDGEDLILDRLLDGQRSGFYVDVGAHHPMRFSNTYLFYLRGWRGINIDAEPGSMRAFQKYRGRDINVECGVAAHKGTLKYYRFDEPALNTFDEIEAKLKDRPPYRLIDKVDVDVRRLDDLLREHLPTGQCIDVLTIDVEGKDEEVLRSNDWAQYRPRFILAETLRTDMRYVGECPVVEFLSTVGYAPIGKAYNTIFFEALT
jgi:FkbM family methyltransferase